MKKKLLSILAGLGFITATIITPIQTASAYNIEEFLQEEVALQNQPRTWKELEKVILERALENKVVMFGEQHNEYRDDNDFAAKLLPELRKQGFEYFALEIDKNPIKKELSDKIKKMFEEYESGKFTIKEIKKRYDSFTEKEITDLSDEFRRILSDYANGKITKKDIHPLWIDNEKQEAAGWFDLIDATKKIGMEILCYAPDPNKCTSWNEREEKLFNNLRELIFDKYPDAKVVVYGGLLHLSEKQTTLDDYSKMYPEILKGEEQLGLKKNKDGRYKCLGAYINEYTEDKTLTVSLVPSYMPPYCDLIMDFTGCKKIRQ